MKQPNSVVLLGHYGGDKTHCLSAWTSTFEELGIKIPDKISDRIDLIFDFVCTKKKKTPAELLDMLADAGHHTPFEKSCIHFLATTDIATHIQCLKHRIGVPINTESARYKELMDDKYYVPEDWYAVKNSKTVSALDRYDYHHIEPGEKTWADILIEYTERGNELYHQCLEDLTPVLGRKRAKESARYFKGYNMQYTMDIMFNWRSFAHFQNLRNDKHSQKEIRELADVMLQQVKSIEGNPFELTIKAFKY